MAFSKVFHDEVISTLWLLAGHSAVVCENRHWQDHRAQCRLRLASLVF